MHCFPADFVWGVATSDYQVEGGASADGKGVSIWDTFTRRRGAILHGDTGAVACNAYEPAQLEGDLDLIAGLGVHAYIFSVQWPRIQSDGRGAANQKGLDYYRRLVDGLLARSTVDRFVEYERSGFFVWSLLDNVEWDSGYRERFGLVHVDYATQARTPKASYGWYRDVVARNALPR